MDWINTKDKLPTPNNTEFFLVAFRIKEATREWEEYLQIGIGSYNLNEKGNPRWVIIENQVHEYPANYWEGCYRVEYWQNLPELPN